MHQMFDAYSRELMEELEMVTDARRLLGYAGTFVNCKALTNKFIEAYTFDEALKLKNLDTGCNSRPHPGQWTSEDPIAGKLL